MTLILGIDPGSRCTGYGIVSLQQGKTTAIVCGQIRANHNDLSTRLLTIHQGIQDVIQKYHPDEISIEQVFMGENPQSALKLGQARGVVLLAAAMSGIPVSEYTPRQIKLAVVGYGNASKTQIQLMIRALLHLQETPPSDAADALAIALCHAHCRKLAKQLQEA